MHPIKKQEGYKQHSKPISPLIQNSEREDGYKKWTEFLDANTKKATTPPPNKNRSAIASSISPEQESYLIEKLKQTRLF